MRVDGTDVSPGLRRGGWLNTVQKTLECSTLGIKIPPFLSANVARLEIGDKIFFQVRLHPRPEPNLGSPLVASLYLELPHDSWWHPTGGAYSDEKVANRKFVGGDHLTDFPLYDCTPRKFGILSIVQGPLSVAPCQTLALRFATFAALQRIEQVAVFISDDTNGVVWCSGSQRAAGDPREDEGPQPACGDDQRQRTQGGRRLSEFRPLCTQLRGTDPH